MLHNANRRRWIQGTATALGAAAVAPKLFAQGAPVRVGYAIARTGPWAAGAQVSQEPNYLLWADQVNAAGGLSVKGAKRPIELIGATTTAAKPRPAFAPSRSSWAATRST